MTAYSTQTNDSAEQLIVICEANSNVGFGHFFRCLHLVDSLRKEYGINAYWVGNIAPSLVELLRQRNQQHIFTSHFDKAITEARSLEARAVLCDSYQLAESHIQQLRHKFRVCIVDDFGKSAFADADTVINFTVSAPRYRYSAKQQLLGPRFFLCDDALNQVRERRLNQVDIKCDKTNVLIAIGGHDRLSVGPKIAETFLLDSKYTVTLIGHYSSVKSDKNLLHITRSNDMASLYDKADLVVSGGGLIKYESAYCGIPNIVLAQTPEQFAETLEFEAAKLCHIAGSAPTDADLVAQSPAASATLKTASTTISWSPQELLKTADKALSSRKKLIQATKKHFENNATAKTAKVIFNEHFTQE